MTIRELKVLSLAGTTTIDIAPGNNFVYKIDCSYNFGSGSINVTANGSPLNGTSVIAYCDFGGATNYNESSAFCNFFGTVIPAELVGIRFTIIAIYDGSWEVYFVPDWKEDDIIATTHIQDNAVTTAKIANVNVTTAKIADTNVTEAKIASNAVTAAKINDGAVTLAKMADMTANGFLGNDSGGAAAPQELNLTETRTLLSASTALTGDVIGSASEIASTGVTTVNTTLSNGVVTVAKVAAPLKRQLITGVCSFETNEVGYTAVKVPWNCTVDEWAVNVIKTIEASNDGTCELYDHSGTLMTGSGITVTAGTTVGSGAPPSSQIFNAPTITANNALTAGQILTIKTAKTTAGGRLQYSIKVTLT